MSSFNKITICGYLAVDPKLSVTPNGTKVCTFSIATDEKTGTKEITTWFRVTFWREKADLVATHLVKGSQVLIEGRLGLREYADAAGLPRTSLEVTGSEIHFLGKSAAARTATSAAA